MRQDTTLIPCPSYRREPYPKYAVISGLPRSDRGHWRTNQALSEAGFAPVYPLVVMITGKGGGMLGV